MIMLVKWGDCRLNTKNGGIFNAEFGFYYGNIAEAD